MQDLDAVAAAGHGAARGEGDGESRRGQDEQDDGEARGDDGAGHGGEAPDPKPVVVQRRGRYLAAQRRAEAGEIGAGIRPELEHDQARHRQFDEIEPRAEPGL